MIEPILWNYIIDNDSEEGKEMDESSSDEEDDSVVSHPQRIGSSVILFGSVFLLLNLPGKLRCRKIVTVE